MIDIKEKAQQISSQLSDLEEIFIQDCYRGNIDSVKLMYKKLKHSSSDFFIDCLKKSIPSKLEAEFNKGNLLVIDFLINQIKEIKEFKYQNLDILVDIAYINDVHLMNMVLNSPKMHNLLNIDILSFVCYKAIESKSYDVANYLGKNAPVVADFTNDRHNVYHRLTDNIEALMFFFKSPIFKNQINLSCDHNMIWYEIIKDKHKIDIDLRYKAFEFLSNSKTIGSNIDFVSNDYEGFKKLTKTGNSKKENDIRALNCLKKNKKIWLNKNFYNWMIFSCNEEFVSVFKKSFIILNMNSLEKLISPKENKPNTPKIKI